MGRTIEANICDTTLQTRHVKRGEDEVWIKDLEVRGFYAREKPEGARIFVFRWRLDGRNRSITIGIYGSDCDCEQARIRAMEMRTAVRMKKDPRAVLEKIQEDVRTVAQAVKEYTEKIAAGGKHAPGTVAEYTRILNKKVVPILGERHVADIAFKHVEQLHIGLQGTPREANNVVTVFKVFLGWCRRMGYRPAGLPSVTEGLEYFTEEVRERMISPDELQRMLAALNALFTDGLVSRHFYYVVWLMVLTGARRGQVEQLRWDQVDFVEGIMSLKPKDTRRKRSRRAPKKDVRRLTGVTLRIMQHLHETRDEECPWVFPAETQSGHLENTKRPWSALLKAASLSNLHRHDLRHHYATEALEAGIQPKVASDLTGHSEEIITQRFYQVTSARVARKAQAKLSHRILLKGGEEPHLPMKELKGVAEDGHPAPGSALNGHRPQHASPYPNKETLQRMVNEMPVTAIAKQLGVSDNAVARECRKHGIVKPGRGEWAKLKAAQKLSGGANGTEG